MDSGKVLGNYTWMLLNSIINNYLSANSKLDIKGLEEIKCTCKKNSQEDNATSYGVLI